MSWKAALDVGYRYESQRTVARHSHLGPLRILQSLYPEGGAICHNVLVHPPGGLVGGDTLGIGVDVGSGAHALITTPGATRFYRSLGEPAVQDIRIRLESGARLEWLPLEAICHPGCIAQNRLSLMLAPGAEMMGWDITALGLPASGQAFDSGSFCQHIEIPGVWLERGRMAADDPALMNGALGLAGRRCIASLFFCTGSAIERGRQQQALDGAREAMQTHSLCDSAGVTSPNGQVVVLRVLSPMVEPAMDLLRRVWAQWRLTLWQLQPQLPRIWST